MREQLQITGNNMEKGDDDVTLFNFTSLAL